MAGDNINPIIYEDRYTQMGKFDTTKDGETKKKEDSQKVISDINTPEQMKRGSFYRIIWMQLEAEMNNREIEWNELERIYNLERDIIEGCPNSFIPVTAPIINGQIAALVDNNISANVKGKGLSDQKFAHTGQMLTNLVLKENKIKQKIKLAAKRYLNLGTGCYSVGWNPDEYGGIGLPEIRAVQIPRVYVDGKIKELTDFQKAEWVIEDIGFKSINWIRMEYGDEIANAVVRLNHIYPFDGETAYDDINSTSILVIWTRNNEHGNLQKIVMDKRGMIFEESDPETPYYEFVNNKYPYFFFGMYLKEGSFYRFGDGKLLKGIQETVNRLYDEIVTACKFAAQRRTFIDKKAECDVDQFDSDPSHPIICNDPKGNIYDQQGAGINEVVFRLVQDLMNQAQKVTRFSSLMSGNSPEERMTATQAGIQVQQGNNTINDKKTDISEALSGVVEYCLGLLMEFWGAAQALRVSENKDEFEWIDPRVLGNVPIMIPIDADYEKKWKKEHPNSPIEEMPNFMQLHDKNNNPMTKNVAFDIDISIGEGLPNNKVALYNIILSLAQLQLPDEQTGQPKPLIGYRQVRTLIEDLIGLPIEDILQPQPNIQPNQIGTGNMPNVNPVNINPNIPGANMNGTAIGGK